jgi:glutamine synthetase
MSRQREVGAPAITRLDQERVSHYFGCNTFSDRTMKERLPQEVYEGFRDSQRRGELLSPELAHGIAQAMQEWAMEQGATHFTHWFLPMTGQTAEKHDAFITWEAPGQVIERFKGSQLVQGEPDASSFPSGGLRATFEARGYTIWDTSSPAFIMDGPLGRTLCIPTAFVGYHGQALDHKVPLLRSMQSVERATQATLALFQRPLSRITVNIGPEQEYFLVDLELFRQRADLMYARRTLQGARPPKGQELEDHYFGSIKERVLGFMQEVELECFKLGIPAKTRHNEVAPNQFEMAPLFEPANIASDHNQLLMEVLRAVGERHGLAVLLHEKPFAGVNGSGKHVNWSLATEDGHNLLEPGQTPGENLQFLYFLAACLRAIHTHGGLLRAAIASAGNDHRLGANEAPPAIMSVFLGTQLDGILDAIARKEEAEVSEAVLLDLGLSTLPLAQKDATDRNRTSPFAFTGNKFEFRAVGSSQPIAFPITVINAALAQALGEMNRSLQEKLEGGKEFRAAVLSVVRRAAKETRAIRFEGNGYSPEWKVEAEARGLPHARDTVAALATFELEGSRGLFTEQAILTADELEARLHIRHEQYQKTVAIEAQVLREIAETMLLPAVMEDLRRRADTLVKLAAAGVDVPHPLKAALDHQTRTAGLAQERLAALKVAMVAAEALEAHEARTAAYGATVRGAQESLRDALDTLEKDCAAELWPIPVYRELMAPLI